MRIFTLLALSAVLLLAPMTANAGFILSASLGKGTMVKPEVAATQATLLVAPGYGLGEMLRFELGLVGALPDVENSKFDLALRPMFVIDPPLLPFYARLIFGVDSLLNEPAVSYGAALGIGGSLFGLGAYLEGGVLPSQGGDTIVIEGRVGAYYAFD